MLLFRSEEHVDRWCVERKLPRGVLLTIDQGWQLAKEWYADRLDPNYRGKTPEENGGYPHPDRPDRAVLAGMTLRYALIGYR